MELPIRDPGIELASAIRSLNSLNALFWRLSSPRVMATGLVIAVTVRLSLIGATGVGWFDLVAVVIVVTLIPFVEWFIHLLVLHARPRQLGRLTIDPGVGHRQHHRHPASVNYVLLRGIDAGLFQVINAGLVVVVVGGPLWLIGARPLGPILTGVVVAILGLLHYEWSHLLFHTAYRPRSRYYRRLKQNHRLHHWRNERFWLGITTNAGDRLLRTYPASRSAVPLSPTAKTLGVDPQRSPGGSSTGSELR